MAQIINRESKVTRDPQTDVMPFIRLAHTVASAWPFRCSEKGTVPCMRLR